MLFRTRQLPPPYVVSLASEWKHSTDLTKARGCSGKSSAFEQGWLLFKVERFQKEFHREEFQSLATLPQRNHRFTNAHSSSTPYYMVWAGRTSCQSQIYYFNPWYSSSFCLHTPEDGELTNSVSSSMNLQRILSNNS